MPRLYLTGCLHGPSGMAETQRRRPPAGEATHEHENTYLMRGSQAVTAGDGKLFKKYAKKDLSLTKKYSPTLITHRFLLANLYRGLDAGDSSHATSHDHLTER
jgi:hypothetical protein